jgi:hypothetical protein
MIFKNEKLYTIEDLRNGICAVINDGTLEELNEVLKIADGNIYKTSGLYKHYFFYKTKAICTNEIDLPKQSVKTFLNQKNMQEQTLTRIQLLDSHFWFECDEIKNAIEEILEKNKLAKDNDKIVIEQKYIDKLLINGSKEQINFFKNLGLVFEKDNSVDLSISTGIIMMENSPLVMLIKFSNYRNKAFYLNQKYNWKLVTDDGGVLVLVPTKK